MVPFFSTSLKTSQKHSKKRIFGIFALFCLLVFTSTSQAKELFTPLNDYLLGKGFNKKTVANLLNHKDVSFEGKILARMLSVSESRLNYGQFLSKKSVKQSREFKKKHKAILKKAKQKTGVSAEVVVAILKVETGFGSYTGKHNVFNILASQSVLDTPKGVAELKKYWPSDKKKKLNSAKTKKRFKKRAKWAKGEVASLLKLAVAWRISPFSLQGSPAGAFGMCQFVPTSALKWSYDGNKDGKIDLYNTHDAIYSVAQYLKKHGWRPGLSKKAQKKVILTYNNSTPYATTILKLARRLR